MDQETSNEPNGIYFRRLDNSKKEIRLLRLYPCEDDEDRIIKGSLQITSLEDEPKYTALSYMWGNEGVQYEQAIRTQVDGHDVHVTFNLMLALLYLRPRITKAILIWIDALCINQKDDKEKAGQIPLMREIYQKAFDVLIWLGKEADQSDLAMDFIHEAHQYTIANPDISPPLREWTRTRLDDPSHAERWKALSQLCTRPYWTRCWIVQEIVVHHRPVLLCGLKGLPARTLFEMAHHIWTVSLPGIETNPPIVAKAKGSTLSVASIGDLWIDFHKSQPDEKVDLLDMVVMFRHFRCSNPRDRIYSLLGIAKPYDGPAMPVDYETSMSTFYRDVAAHIIRGSRSLDILRFAVHDGDALHRIPSWVPDWSYAADTIHEPIISNESRSERYDDEVEVISRDILKVKAHIIGPIHAVVSYQPVHDEASAIDELIAWTRSVASPAFIPLDHDTQEGITRSLEEMAIAQYKTLFYTWEESGMIQSAWPAEDFIVLVQSLWKAVPQNPHLSGERWDLLRRALHPSRRFFKCKLPEGLLISYRENLLGSCSKAARIGDVVAVLPGCSCPVILKALHEPHCFELICGAYIYALMDRSALRFFPTDDIFLH
jgi:hypothetical protein